MTSIAYAAPVPKSRLWAGRILTAIPVLFLIFDVGIHLMQIQPVLDAFANLGFPARLITAISLIELACLVLYLIPRTAVLGAILLTGYLGGAVATNLRVEAPLFSNTLFPVYVGILLWAGLLARKGRVREVVLGERR